MRKKISSSLFLLLLLLGLSLFCYSGVRSALLAMRDRVALEALLQQIQVSVSAQLHSAQLLLESRKSSSNLEEKQALRQSLASRDTLNELWTQLAESKQADREVEAFIRDLQYEGKTLERNMQDLRGGPEGRQSIRKVQEQGRLLQDKLHSQLLLLQQLNVDSQNRGTGLIHLWFWGAAVLLAALSGIRFWIKRRERRILANYLALSHDLTKSDNTPGAPSPDEIANQAAEHELSQALELLSQRFQEASRHKDKFFASMSHEIRTPLNGLVGFLSNLSETPLNDQQKQYLRIIESSARSLMQVINEILDYSKIQAGQLSLEEIAFDLRNFLEERIAIARQLARNKNLKVILDFPGHDPLIIRTDPSRLRQILDNLLSNAVKFTDRGEVILEVRQLDDQNGRLNLAFAVRDSGVGIPLPMQQKLFKPFAQADDTIARRYGGTGLGLSISSALVKLLGGELSPQSRPGEGSCFFFSLRLVAAKPEEQVRISELYRITLPRTELKKHWALLVDDTPTNLFLLETICQSVGLPYRTAENGREALELCRQQRFDLIFMDIQMPIMDGYTAIREIRKLPNSGMTHIIALTASAFQEDIDQALGAGSTGFIPKPFERDQLLLCIADALGMTPERKIREPVGPQETAEGAIVRRMHDFMREQYQISLGEIKMILGQTVSDWRPVLDNLATYSQQGNSDETIAILQRLKGQLLSVGLLDQAEQTVTIMQAFKHNQRSQAQTLVISLCQTLTRIFKTLEQEVTVKK